MTSQSDKPVTLLHASDLHFGTTTDVIVDRLREDIQRHAPDHVILSGDFTQSGRKREFQTARRFIDSLNRPVFVVPGNHDFSRFNPFELFIRSYRRYKKYINEDLCPTFSDHTVHIVGLNTARPYQFRMNWANGRVSKDQVQEIGEEFARGDPKACHILVCHHPLVAIEDSPLNITTTNADHLLEALYNARVELVLTGHIHHASVTTREKKGRAISFVGASTATSSRLRHQANGYNLIRIEKDKIHIDHYHLEAGKFVVFQTHEIERNSFLL